MTSDLKIIYENQYDEYIYNDNELNADSYDDTPIGWSFICFDETISYYTDCNNRTLNSSMIDRS